MPRRTEPYTFAEVDIFVIKASRLISRRYDSWGVSQSDASQEMWAWVYGNQDKIERWLASEPQQTTRIFRSLYDAGLTYAEKEKAERVGYDPDDIHWYSPAMVAGLMPFALDPTFDCMVREPKDDDGYDSPSGQSEDLLTMVVDLRRAIKECGADVEAKLTFYAAGSAAFEDAIRDVVDQLGGARYHIGRREVMTNARAQAINGWDE